jgi:hypothetical protein
MIIWHDRFATHRVLRWAAGAGLAAALMLPAWPVAAQPTQPLQPIVTSGSAAMTEPDCSIQLSLANPSPGDQNVPHVLQISGTAFDRGATTGTGISQIQAFLGDRDEGGALIGVATQLATGPTGSWTMQASLPTSVTGGASIWVYSLSSVTTEEASVAVPIVVGGELAEGSTALPSTALISCPSVLAPTTPIVALGR